MIEMNDAKSLETKNMAQKIQSIVERARKFLYTDWYLILVCVAVYIGWATQNAALGLSLVVIIASVVLLITDDVLPLTISIVTSAEVIYSENFSDYSKFLPMLIPLALCLGVFIFRNRKNKGVGGKMIFPQIAVALAFMLGGVGVSSTEEYVRALPMTLLLGVGVLVIYLFFVKFAKTDGKRDVALYFSRIMMYAGLLICAELLTVILRIDVPTSLWDTKYWNVGWGSRNSVATFLAFSIPLCYYLSTRYKNGWIYLAIGFFQHLCLIMTFSRGGILFGSIGAGIALIYSVIKAPKNKRQVISFSAIVLFCLIIFLIFKDDFIDMIKSLIDRGTSSSGRDKLYEEAFSLFKLYPFLGRGMGYGGNSLCPPNGFNIYWFHSTFFQVIASTGIIGLLLFVYNYCARLTILFKNIKCNFNVFMLCVFIGFEGYSMIDTGTMSPFIIIEFICIFILEYTAKYPFEEYVDKFNRAFFPKNNPLDGEQNFSSHDGK